MFKSSQEYINKLIENPKNVFFIDAIGALLTTLLIKGLLIPFQEFIGLSINTLQTLSIYAALLFSYSTVCFFLIKSNWKPFLAIIFILNIVYVTISLYLILKSDSITTLGLLYFILELLVIIILILIEIKVFLKLNSKP